MKPFLIALATVAIVGSPAQARVGETEQQIKARYGEGNMANTQRIPGAVTFEYSQDAFQIEVVMLAGKSI